jgi:hypothetical protein
MDAEDWLKLVEKKLEIAQCFDREKVMFIAHQLFGTAADCGRLTTTLTPMLRLSPRISSRLTSGLTTCPAAPSS